MVIIWEFQLVEYFINNKEQILSKEQIYDKVWEIENEIESNNLEVYLSFIRRKLKAIGTTVTIKAVRGLGYKMDDENVKFMDRVIYTVLIDDKDNIKDVINHSNNEIASAKIASVAEKILTSDNIKEKFIGNLYFEDYSYSYVKGNWLTILDNGSIKKSLLSSLKISVAILAVSEIFVLLICKLITSWIIKPVKESFEKQKKVYSRCFPWT